MMAELPDDEIPVYGPYGFDVVASADENENGTTYHHEGAEERAREQMERFEQMKKTANLAVELGATD